LIASIMIDTDVRSDEAWTGFMDEGEELINFWEGPDKSILVFSGDLHNSSSIRITDRIWEE
jgi:alkaline phosphatase D